MAKLFSTILFSFFLLFQTTTLADDDNTSTEVVEESEEKEAQEELSELEKEALAAEQAELRESGIYDEPVEE